MQTVKISLILNTNKLHQECRNLFKTSGWIPRLHYYTNFEAPLESVMCDVIKIRLKRRDTTISGKGNQPLNFKRAVEWPILKLGIPKF